MKMADTVGLDPNALLNKAFSHPERHIPINTHNGVNYDNPIVQECLEYGWLKFERTDKTIARKSDSGSMQVVVASLTEKGENELKRSRMPPVYEAGES